MRFKPEISFDGVAFIGLALVLVAGAVTMKNTVDGHGKMLEQHTSDIREIHQTQSSLADNLSVLTAIVNERTGSGRPDATIPQTRR